MPVCIYSGLLIGAVYKSIRNKGTYIIFKDLPDAGHLAALHASDDPADVVDVLLVHECSDCASVEELATGLRDHLKLGTLGGARDRDDIGMVYAS